MSDTISNVFVTEYSADLKHAYQQGAALLRKTVFLKTGVKGDTVKFPKIGKGKAVQKTRHGIIPAMNVEHTRVTAAMENWYAPDWVDDFDLMMTNIDDRTALAEAGAAACGRKVDELVLNQMALTDNIVGDGTTAFGLSLVQNGLIRLNDKTVPNVDRFAAVGSVQWEELMGIDAFAKAEYVGDKKPWLQNTEAKTWRGMTWIHHTGLPLSGTVRSCFMWHKRAVGLGEVSDIVLKTKYEEERDSWFVNNKMSLGGVLIDSEGVVKIQCLDNGGLA
ncbi:phage capsid protein [Desulfovibrio caledoniensis]